jgi:hypothetical protein
VWGASRIGAGQVDLLADTHQHRVAGECFAEFAALLVDHAEHLEHREFATVIQHIIATADPDGTFDIQLFHQDRRTASVTEHDGAVNVHASGGDPLRVAEMKAVFDRAVNTEFDDDCEHRRRLHGDGALAHPLPRSADQRRFDAMYQIFIASVTVPANGKRPEPLVNFVIDPTTGLESLVRHGMLELDETEEEAATPGDIDPLRRRCATTTGTPVHLDVVVRAMIHGNVRRVIVDTHDVVINLGRTQRLFTGKARDTAQLLAVRCGHRGCDVPSQFCDIDHLDEWAAHGGHTDQTNALPLCGVHDRWKHRQRLRGRRDRHGHIHLITPDGTVIKPLNAHDPTWAEPDEPVGSVPTHNRSADNDPPIDPPAAFSDVLSHDHFGWTSTAVAYPAA